MKKVWGKLDIFKCFMIAGFAPMLLSVLVLVIMIGRNYRTTLEEDTYSKLETAAIALREYFSYDVVSHNTPEYLEEHGGHLVDYDEYSDHVYMESLQGENVEMTLFEDDTRFLTSIKDANGHYIEETK
ncbi:MAG: hypothetical protein K6F84_09080, partial [Lachnospiraceae bacterium]|nr:hypothetical protein [Lachnospiraceae bacterium]